jgi:O-antigen ligase
MAEQTSTGHWWNSRLVGGVDLLLALALIPLLIRLAMEEDVTWLAGVAVGLVVCVLTGLRWPYGALFVVVGMSAMPVYFVELLGWKARPEHFAAAVVLAAIFIRRVFAEQKLVLNKIDYWVFAFIAANFISSAVASTDRSSTLRWALQNSLAVIAYFLIRVLIRDWNTFRKAFAILVTVGIAESVYGIICYVSHYTFGTTFGMSVGQYLVDVAAPYAAMYEPNLFGAYAGCYAVMCLAVSLLGRARLRSAIGFLIASLATVLSYSRAALVALIIGIVWVFWKSRHARSSGTRIKLAIPLLAFVLICVIALYAAGGVLQKRFEDLYYQGFMEGTTMGRLVIMEEAIMDIPGHVLLGNGTASFNISFDWNRFIPEWASDKTWIGNAPLRVMHDTGLVGLTAFLGFFVVVWRKLRRTWKKDGVRDGMLLGLAAGLVLYAFSFEFTDGTNLAFFWVHLGFLATAAVLSEEHPSADDGTGLTAIE